MARVILQRGKESWVISGKEQMMTKLARIGLNQPIQGGFEEINGIIIIYI